jgi:hypothetical protein
MPDITLTVRDETTSGDLLGELELQLSAEEVDVGEIIRARVHQEVRAYNASPNARFGGLVAPTDHEARLHTTRGARKIDAEKQAEVARAAFVRGQVLILVDDRQVTELDERVVLRGDSSVTFLKLVPLVGG